jgi:hypothetical protein
VDGSQWGIATRQSEKVCCATAITARTSASDDDGGAVVVVDVVEVGVDVDVLGVVDVEVDGELLVVVTMLGSVTLGVLSDESDPSAHATAPRARIRSAVVPITRRPTARSTPHIGLSSAYVLRSTRP